MAIEFHCTGCPQRLKVAEALAGKQVRCPKCKAINEVPFLALEIEQETGFSEQPLRSENLPVASEVIPEVCPVLPLDQEERQLPSGSDSADDYDWESPVSRRGLYIAVAIGACCLFLFCIAGVGAVAFSFMRMPSQNQVAENPQPAPLVPNVKKADDIEPRKPEKEIMPPRRLETKPVEPPVQFFPLPPPPTPLPEELPPIKKVERQPAPPQAPDPVKIELPKSTTPMTQLAGQVRTLRDLKVTTLDVEAKNAVGDICWSEDGRYFFLLDQNGRLSKIRAADFVEECQLDIMRRCGWLAQSKEGLLLALVDLQEVWIVDPAKLKVTKRIPAPSVARIAASPASSIAVAGSTERRDSEVSILDLKKGQIVSQSKIPFTHARMTPDGKYLFAQGGIEQMIRYRLEGTDLIEEETSLRIAQNGQAIAISPDSKYVCLPSGGGNYRSLPNHPPAKPYCTYVYGVADLSRPIFTMQSGAYPRAVGFDPKGKYAFTQNSGTQLILFTMTGIKLHEYTLSGGGRDNDSRFFAPHPQGGSLLILTGVHLFHVVLPAAED